jgi:hypothetical protein
MTFGAGVFLASVVVAVLVLAAGRYLSRQRLVRGRQPRAVTEIVNDLPDAIGRNEASEVLQVIGQSFRVRPEILRLDDPMSSLTAIDSWTLGHGQEALERWLRAKGITNFQRNPVTIRELILAVLLFDAHREGVSG